MSFIQQFKNYLFSQKPKPSYVTVKNYSADIKKFIVWFETAFVTSFNPVSVNLEMLKVYKEFLLKTFSMSSVERQFSALRKFFQFLQINNFINSNPFDSLLIAL